MSITVYWAPNYEFGNIDWNMLYADPISVFDKQIEQKTTVDKWDSMFYCPAFKNLTKNTLEFKNPLASTFLFDEQGNVTPSKNGMTAQTVRQPSVTMTSPWLETPQWASQANIVPGRYNIGKWFRAVNIEFMMGQGVKELTIEKDEPLAYFTFNTDEHVKFVRFKMDPELRRYSVSCATSTSWEPWIPLADRYRRFQESRMRSIILKKIKENIVE